MKLSEKLKILRKKKGLSQLELSEEIGVSRQAVSGWEAGSSKPSIENLQLVSQLYGVSLENLLDEEWDDLEGEKIRAVPDKERYIPLEVLKKARKKYIVILVIVISLIVVMGLFIMNRIHEQINIQMTNVSREEVGEILEGDFDVEW